MKVMNNLLSNDIHNPINSLQLSYTSNNVNTEKNKLVNEMTDNSLLLKTLHLSVRHLPSTTHPVYEVRMLQM